MKGTVVKFCVNGLFPDRISVTIDADILKPEFKKFSGRNMPNTFLPDTVFLQHNCPMLPSVEREVVQ